MVGAGLALPRLPLSVAMRNPFNQKLGNSVAWQVFRLTQEARCFRILQRTGRLKIESFAADSAYLFPIYSGAVA